jgi:dTMP kinase
MTNKLPRGAVIMFDGPDGVGKTTQLVRAQSDLEQAGYNVFTARVNGGTPIGEALREIMLADYERPPLTDLYIHLAQQHALNVEVQRHRQAGTITLIDRSFLSIIAYQVFGSQLDTARGYAAADEVKSLFQPDLLLVYSANPVVLQSRRALDGRKGDYFDSKPTDYLERAIAGYEEAAARYQATIIDALGDIDTVHEETMRHINETLAKLTSEDASAPSAPGSGR